MRTLYARTHLDQVLLTFGFSFVFLDLVRMDLGRRPASLSEPDSLSGRIEILGGILPFYRLALLGFGVLIAVALWLVLERTRVGAMVRAGVDDASTAMGIGINVPLLLTAIFAVGAALAALTGAPSRRRSSASMPAWTSTS